MSSRLTCRDCRDSRDCRHFDDDPASLERRLAHLAILGSAYSSTRGAAGLCAISGRLLEPLSAEGCPSFAERPTFAERPSFAEREAPGRDQIPDQ